MANTYLTIAMITYEMLMVLHNTVIAGKKVTRKYDKQFAVAGAKIGNTVQIRKPPRYVVTKGSTFVGQDYNDEYVTLTVDQHDQIGVEFANDDMTLSMDDFSGRVIKPALVPIANSVDIFILSQYNQVWNTTGTPGTIAATDTPFLDAKTLLMNNAAVLIDSPMLVTPNVSARLSSGLAGRFNPSPAISELYTEGEMGKALGWDFFQTQNMPTQQVGAWQTAVAATPASVNAANQTGSAITTAGWANTITNLGLIGDVVQFQGVYMVNPITKNNTGQLQNFVLTANVTSSGGGLATLNISPSIILTGKNQTVTASPANGAFVYVYGVTNVTGIVSAASPTMLGWGKDAITLACVDLAIPGKEEGVKAVRVSDEDLGLSFTYMRGFDIREYSNISRFDILYGSVLTRPEHVSRVQS